VIENGKSFLRGRRNVILPGQYYDSESGLNYNYMRDLDPTVRRYIESDPEGLIAGLNTYAYVRGRPTMLVDPKGTFGSLPGPNELLHDVFDTPSGCTVIAAISEYNAFKEAADSKTPGIHNGPQDAFRHCTWSCKMARLGGADCARMVGSNHEVSGLDSGGSLNEFDMDSREEHRYVGHLGSACDAVRADCFDSVRSNAGVPR
jgi:RHS repeat-associated protein